jgi:hypothetical protein
MATQTQADRTAAGKKAAATRERNEKREASKEAGRKGVATRLVTEARENLDRARTEAGKATSSVGNVAKSTGGAAYKAGRSVAARVGIGGKS